MGNTRSGWQNHTNSGDLLTVVQRSGPPFRNVPGYAWLVSWKRLTVTGQPSPPSLPQFGRPGVEKNLVMNTLTPFPWPSLGLSWIRLDRPALSRSGAMATRDGSTWSKHPHHSAGVLV